MSLRLPLRRSVCATAIAVMCLGTQAQRSGTIADSLRARLRDEQSGSERVRLLIEYGSELYDAQGDTAGLSAIEEGIALARHIRDAGGTAYEPLPGAIRALNAGRYVEAIAAFKESIARLDEQHVPQSLDSPLGLIRKAFMGAGRHEERFRFYTEAIERYGRKGMRSNLATSYHGLGGYYLVNRQYAQAAEQYLRAREIFKQVDPIAAANETLVLGMVYEPWGNLERAERFIVEGIEMNRALGAQQNVARGLGLLGLIMLERGDTAQALARFRSMLDNQDRIGITDRALGHSLLVKTYVWTHALDSARVHLRTLNQMNEAYDIPLSSTYGQCEIDYCNYLLLRAIGEDSEADDRLEAALTEAQLVRDPSLILKYRKELAGRLVDRGNYTRASLLQGAYIRMRDSLQTLADRGAVASYENQLREQEDAMEIGQQQGKLARQRLALYAIAVSAALLTILVVIIARNNLQKRRANHELEVARQRAEASEKFKQQFLANMSHEIRTPMNAIMGMTGILKRNEQLPEQKKYLDAIAQSSENLLVILNDILDLSKLEAGKIDLEQVAFDPRQVIGNVGDILRFKAEEKGLALEVHFADDVPSSLLGDPTRLNQIVLNLAGNAVKFTEHGSVTIRASWTSRGELAVDVIDTGIGIPEDRLDKIFDEFTQAYSDTTRKYGGTGLGLTISKRLAEMQGGCVTVSSEQGKGSTFTVRIPYAIASSIVEAPGQALSDNAVGALRDLRILLAEDNEFNAMVAQDELADAIPGVHVHVAVNGRIAVEMATANDYDVILMDVQMPEMNGYDATRAIRTLPDGKSRVPILAMTANVMKEELERCKEAGMNGHVPKPFKREELIGGLHHVLDPRPQ